MWGRARPYSRRLTSSFPLLALLEPVHAALGVNDPLVAREEGMTNRADLRLEFLLRGSGDEGVAAQAAHYGVMVVGRMDGGLHGEPIIPSTVRRPRERRC